jgi:hypothetical protein
MITADFSAARWRKSSRSSEATNCVEVAFAAGGFAVRDSKHPDGPILIFPTRQGARLPLMAR